MKTYRIEWKRFEFSEIALLSKEKHTPTKEDDFKCIELEHIDRDTGNINGYKNAEEVISTKNVFYKGDILFGKLRPYLRKFAKPKFNGLCSSEIWVLKNTDKSTSNFLFYLIQTNRFIDIVSTTSGTRMPRADWKLISKAIFPVPPIGEQERIAEVLSCWDKAIEENLKIIALKEKRKKALMQSLLNPKKDWKSIKIGDLGEIVSGGTPSTENAEFWNGDIPWISSSDLTEESINQINISRFITKEAIKKSSTKLIPKKSLLVVSRVGVGKMAVSNVDLCTSQDFQSIILEKNKINIKYFAFQLKESFIHHILRVNQGTSIKGFCKSDLVSYKIPLPPYLTDQEKIAEILSGADEGISLHKAKVELLKKQKKYLMQVLLSGKVRLASS